MESNVLDPNAKRGFAAMPPDRQRQIASKGGKVAHEQGVAYKWSKEEAKEAGRKGGINSGKRRHINRAENDGCDHFL